MSVPGWLWFFFASVESCMTIYGVTWFVFASLSQNCFAFHLRVRQLQAKVLAWRSCSIWKIFWWRKVVSGYNKNCKASRETSCAKFAKRRSCRWPRRLDGLLWWLNYDPPYWHSCWTYTMSKTRRAVLNLDLMGPCYMSSVAKLRGWIYLLVRLIDQRENLMNISFCWLHGLCQRRLNIRINV